MSRQGRHGRHGRRSLGVFALALVTASAAACGSGDDDTDRGSVPAADAPAGTEPGAVPGSVVGSDGEQAGGGSDAGTGVDEALDVLGLDGTADAWVIALGGGEAEVIDGTTVRITLDGGSVATDAVIACASGSALFDPSITLIAVYPDGEHVCN